MCVMCAAFHCSAIPNNKMALIVFDEAQQALKALRDLQSTRLESVVGNVPVVFVDGEKPIELDGILYDNLHNWTHCRAIQAIPTNPAPIEED